MEATGIEKRRIRRLSSDQLKEIDFQIAQETKTHRAIIRDHSIQGMGLVSNKEISTGTPILIHVKHSRSTAIIDALVRHVTPLDEVKWLLGCEFARLLTAQDF